jgi:hypothetical protein
LPRVKINTPDADKASAKNLNQQKGRLKKSAFKIAKNILLKSGQSAD